MDAYEARHDSSLTANATKSLDNQYDLRAFHQLTWEIFVAASVKYVEGNGEMKSVQQPHRVLWPSIFIHGYGLDNEYNITVTIQRFSMS